MDVLEMEALLRNVDQRLQRVEQILPTLATKEDLRELATKAEIRELATKAEIRELATKAEIGQFATKAEVREEGERTRRYFDVVAERLSGQIQLVAEGYGHLAQRLEEVRVELKTDIANLDVRVMRLETMLKSSTSRSRRH